ncbi:SPOR domain-containing protein [Aurantiacibacter odishensis]|uniref:SPOR domain-containing protein n=1 Tax=Aurantiacibacter odishensis TaxID=1155476 RepID=UPI000E74D620|nr:SPOR domain-containing protein [Aurantiacibacter odishensis]
MSLPAGGRGANGIEDAEFETYEAEEQLPLQDDDDALPWLEDDGDYEDEGGFDARLIWLALAGLLVIAVILLGAWWLLRDRPDAELVADGTTIEAPDSPYKERPEDPGGREVAGTGDTAYAVAEGQSTRGMLAEDAPSPEPSIDISQDDEAAEEAAPSGAAYVQIGAFTSRADAEQAWVSARGRYSVLSGMRSRIVEAEVNGATVYRLQAIAPSREAGDATCRAIRNAGGDCYIR